MNNTSSDAPNKTGKKHSGLKGTERNAMIAVGVICFAAASLGIAFIATDKTQKKSSPEQNNSPEAPAEMGRLIECNTPGLNFNLSTVLQSGKKNVFYFHSKQCPACNQMEPLLTKLASVRPDLAIFLVDIDRRDSEDGIDFQSPVAVQHSIDRVPYFKIYDGSSHLIVAKGSPAKQMVKEWMIKEGVAR